MGLIHNASARLVLLITLVLA